MTIQKAPRVRKCRSCGVALPPDTDGVEPSIRCEACEAKFKAWLDGEPTQVADSAAAYTPRFNGMRALELDEG